MPSARNKHLASCQARKGKSKRGVRDRDDESLGSLDAIPAPLVGPAVWTRAKAGRGSGFGGSPNLQDKVLEQAGWH